MFLLPQYPGIFMFREQNLWLRSGILDTTGIGTSITQSNLKNDSINILIYRFIH
jgi:hypothetical protein